MFGELALLYNAPRSASIKCLVDSYFWVIDRTAFKNVVEEVTAKQFQENRTFLETAEIFSTMVENQKDSIAQAMISQKYNPGAELVSKGDQADSYFIIKEGIVECVEENGKVIRFVLFPFKNYIERWQLVNHLAKQHYIVTLLGLYLSAPKIP
jgi:cGMP-dependent protein kinase